MATSRLGEHLGANRCNVGENIRDTDMFIVRATWEGWLHGAPNLTGEYSAGDFITPEYRAALEAGQTVTINDVTTDPRTSHFASAYAAFGIGAAMCTPILIEGRWEATMTVNDARPRVWRPDEERLVRETATRVWFAIKRLRR